ncbi:MAG: septum formation initiator family protein [Micavibrio sp.]|nr:septum formation initiator family protein [Micavibrio sp.]
MSELYRNHGCLRGNLGAFLGVCLVLYFGFHALQGSRGIFSYMSLTSQVETLSIESDNLNEKKGRLEQKVAMLRPGHVDKDLLEERVRATLGYKYSDEYAILRH